MAWTVETFDNAVDREIDDFPIDIKVKLEKFRIEIERLGPMSLPRPYAKSLGHGLWELRLTGRDGIARIIYVTMLVNRVVLLRAFMKKTQKTPDHEIKLARQRLKALML